VSLLFSKQRHHKNNRLELKGEPTMNTPNKIALEKLNSDIFSGFETRENDLTTHYVDLAKLDIQDLAAQPLDEVGIDTYQKLEKDEDSSWRLATSRFDEQNSILAGVEGLCDASCSFATQGFFTKAAVVEAEAAKQLSILDAVVTRRDRRKYGPSPENIYHRAGTRLLSGLILCEAANAVTAQAQSSKSSDEQPIVRAHAVRELSSADILNGIVTAPEDEAPSFSDTGYRWRIVRDNIVCKLFDVIDRYGTPEHKEATITALNPTPTQG
jgi:hypothetical protein